MKPNCIWSVLGDDISGMGSGEDMGSGEEDPIELVHVDQNFFYMEHLMRLMALLHSLSSLAMLIAYYHLKVKSIKFILHTHAISSGFGCVLSKNLYVPPTLLKRIR